MPGAYSNFNFNRVFLYLFFFAVIFCPAANIFSQTSNFNFKHVTTSDGLSNGVTTSIVQDKYGYIWIATVNGLSRYDGYGVKIFTHSDKDTFSLPKNLVIDIINDKDYLWIAFIDGICRYEFSTGHFVTEPATKGILVRKMIKDKINIYLNTQDGLGIFNIRDHSVSYPFKAVQGVYKTILNRRPTDIFMSKQGLYIADSALILYHPESGQFSSVQAPGLAAKGIDKVSEDHQGNLWVSCGTYGNTLMKFNSNSSFCFNDFSKNVSDNHINRLFCDSKGRIWATTVGKGLALYDSSVNTFTFFANDPLIVSSISSSNVNSIFEDRKGTIWLGSEGYGINYLQPDNNLFQILLPAFQKNIPHSDAWSRAVAEDDDGNLWLGSINGLAKYNIRSNSYMVLQNDNQHLHLLYNNSIRSLLYYHKDLWVGTASGMNIYHPLTGKIDFLGKKPGEPERSFYVSLLKDHQNNIWMGCKNGIFIYRDSTKKFSELDDHSLTESFSHLNIQALFEDSKHRMWIGTGLNGVFIYDPIQHSVTAMHVDKSKRRPFSIRDFAEDIHGNIWIGSVEGLECYNPETKYDKIYNEDDGLTTINCADLLFDKHHRLWIGTGKGLFVLDSTYKHFRMFSIKDGLPALEMNEQSAFKTRDGHFVYPTLKGFVYFDPENYKELISYIDVYASSFKVFGNEVPGSFRPEELKKISLNYNQNYFSFELTGLNFNNPDQTRYAYRLDPFDKDWTYSNGRIINYTNVPGGDYTFRYKASANDNWAVPEKILQIHIQRIFYKTIWFWAMVFILFALSLYTIYSNRIAQAQKIFLLQSKTQLLEKEKAVVQYESLKQQLNPHFLFNSLTSLRSLIRENQKGAADFLDKLSLNYRYILKNTDSETVSLKDEIEFAETYIQLQHARFGEGLKIKLDISANALDKKIIPVTIQNLIENSIKHNVVDTEDVLKIHIYDQDNYLVVTNNLQLKEHIETSNKYGLKHLQKLYSYFGGRQVIIEQKDDSFTVKIPLI